MGINSMSLAVWLGEDRKCSAAVVGLDLLLGLSISKPTTAAEHFLSSPNHTANDMLLIPIEKILSNRDSIRKAREAYLIQKGKTIDPAGLNIREETY